MRSRPPHIHRPRSPALAIASTTSPRRQSALTSAVASCWTSPSRLWTRRTWRKCRGLSYASRQRCGAGRHTQIPFAYLHPHISPTTPDEREAPGGIPGIRVTPHRTRARGRTTHGVHTNHCVGGHEGGKVGLLLLTGTQPILPTQQLCYTITFSYPCTPLSLNRTSPTTCTALSRPPSEGGIIWGLAPCVPLAAWNCNDIGVLHISAHLQACWRRPAHTALFNIK